MKYIMAFDEGTTSVRTIIYDKAGNTVSSAQREFTQYYPKPGWVEHDASEILEKQLETAREALEKGGLTYENIAAIGITNQRETTVVWDKNTGKPVCNAIVWQCRRTAEYCERPGIKAHSEEIRLKTGLELDAYFSATKLRWILDNVDGAEERAKNGELLFGTIETWLIWNLSGGKLHITDYSNASRTMLFNITSLEWDDDIIKLLDIPRCMLPKAVPSSMIYGETDEKIFGGKICIAGAAGDQQAALFGQTCFSKGDAKNTYGTGAFLLMNIGDKPVFSKNGLVTTIAWGIDGRVNYALEGSAFVCGAVVQWLRDEMKLLESSKDSEKIALSVDNTGGVYAVPAFVGLGAPYWEPYARGAILGITRGTGKAHIVRAALESMAYQVRDLLDAMNRDMIEDGDDTTQEVTSLRVDGGACANSFLMQFQADILGKEVMRPACIETTSLGAAYLAGLAAGYWSSEDEIVSNWQIERVFRPEMSAEEKNEKLKGWDRAVKAVRSWAGDR